MFRFQYFRISFYTSQINEIVKRFTPFMHVTYYFSAWIEPWLWDCCAIMEINVRCFDFNIFVFLFILKSKKYNCETIYTIYACLVSPPPPGLDPYYGAIMEF